MFDARGKRVWSVSGVGAHEYRIDRKKLGVGAYAVRIAAGREIEHRFLIVAF